MNCEELKSRLDAAACSTANYSIGTRENDTFCLEQFDGDWWVFYTERGIVNDPEFRSASEAEARAYLWEKMQHIRHDHLVGLFTNLPRAQDMARTLEQLGLAHHIDPIPSTTPPLYRVFVHGAAIFTARSHFKNLPIRQ